MRVLNDAAAMTMVVTGVSWQVILYEFFKSSPCKSSQWRWLASSDTMAKEGSRPEVEGQYNSICHDVSNVTKLLQVAARSHLPVEAPICRVYQSETSFMDHRQFSDKSRRHAGIVFSLDRVMFLSFLQLIVAANLDITEYYRHQSPGARSVGDRHGLRQSCLG